jgi:hypothetical protein
LTFNGVIPQKIELFLLGCWAYFSILKMEAYRITGHLLLFSELQETQIQPPIFAQLEVRKIVLL